MDRNLRLLGVGAGVRSLGMALFGPFIGLFLYDQLHLAYIFIAAVFVGLGIVPIPISLLGGLLTDRWGRRHLFLLTLGGEAGLVVLLGYEMLLGSLVGAITVAFVSSIVSTLGGPALSAYVADHATGSERTKGFTWWRVGQNAGFAAGVASGGFLVPLLGFGPTTILSGGILAASVAFLAVVLAPSPYDLRLRAGPSKGKGPTSRPAPAPPVGAPPSPTGSANVVVRPPTPTVRRRPPMIASLRVVARDRPFLGFCFAAALAQLTIGQWNNTLALFVHGPMGVSYSVLGLGLALNGAIVVFGQTATTHRMLGHRMTLVALAGLALYVVAFLAFGLATLFEVFPAVVFVAGVAVLTVGENLTAIPYSTLPSNMAPEEERGFYNGGFNAMLTVGALLSTLVGGLALQTLANPLVFWVLLVLPSLPAAWLFRRASRTIPLAVDRA